MKSPSRADWIFPVSWILVLVLLNLSPIDDLSAGCIAFSWGFVTFAIRHSMGDKWSPRYGRKRRLKIALLNVLIIATVGAISFEGTTVGNHIRDPIGWNSNGFVLSDACEAYAGRNGDEVVVRTAQSSFLAMILTQKVFLFVHKHSEPEDFSNLVFSYIPRQIDKTKPKIIWKTSRDVTIQLRLSKPIQIAEQKQKMSVTRLTYDIEYACFANDDRVLKNTQGEVAIMHTVSCYRGNGSMYFVRSVLVKDAHSRHGASILAFQYEPTEMGLGFHPTRLQWQAANILRVTLPQRSILKTHVEKFRVGSIHIFYDLDEFVTPRPGAQTSFQPPYTLLTVSDGKVEKASGGRRLIETLQV